MEQTFNEIVEIVASYSAIIVPIIAYIATGVVAVLKLIGAFKEMAKDVKAKVDEANKKADSKQQEVDELRNQVKLMAQENAETRREMKRLTCAVSKVVEPDGK